jgi:hypothetical protein
LFFSIAIGTIQNIFRDSSCEIYGCYIGVKSWNSSIQKPEEINEDKNKAAIPVFIKAAFIHKFIKIY